MAAAMLAPISACDDGSDDPLDMEAGPAGGKADEVGALGPGQLEVTFAQEVFSSTRVEVWWYPVRGERRLLPIGEIVDVELSTGDCIEVLTHNPARDLDDTIPESEATIDTLTCDFDLRPDTLNRVVLPVLWLALGDYAYVDTGPESYEFGLENIYESGSFHTIIPDVPYVLAPDTYLLKMGGRDNGGMYIPPVDWSSGDVTLNPGDILDVKIPAVDMRAHILVGTMAATDEVPALSTSGCILGNWLTAERGADASTIEFLPASTDVPEALVFPSPEVRFSARMSGIPVPLELDPGAEYGIATFPHAIPLGPAVVEGGPPAQGEFTIERLDDGSPVMCDGPTAEGLNDIERSIFYAGTTVHLPEGRYAQVVSYEGHEVEYTEFSVP